MSALTARQSDFTASCGGEALILNLLLSEDSQASLVKLSFFLKFPVGGREKACSWRETSLPGLQEPLKRE